MSKIVPVRDTREKDDKGWYFKGMVIKKLDTGDYSLVGFESTHCIERKGHVTEFAHNLTEKRFFDVLARLNEMKRAVVILEFEKQALIDWPENAGLTQKQKSFIRTTGKFLRKRLHEIEERYPNVVFIFAGENGREAAWEEFEQWIST